MLRPRRGFTRVSKDGEQEGQKLEAEAAKLQTMSRLQVQCTRSPKQHASRWAFRRPKPKLNFPRFGETHLSSSDG
ncbi:hypothetical protein N7457_001102 [Penicillium paradoxum]|uniref:uncharacterized protein n=1 Tax=Penicillium paradoxum TaxID=176176 RepID=UPI00254906A6|nr:uncharacterized protein N7457_001102 [Penicillium paradoxum]KAJ5794503.1 hypothetical protein N7457_001102 [Penicillium paradoxum]